MPKNLKVNKIKFLKSNLVLLYTLEFLDISNAFKNRLWYIRITYNVSDLLNSDSVKRIRTYGTHDEYPKLFFLFFFQK